MRWKHFSSFAAANLRLCPCLASHLRAPELLASPDPEFRRRVEQDLDYVAVRPFETLDLDATRSRLGGTSTSYTVWCHTGMYAAPLSQRQSVFSQGEGPRTIRLAFAHLRAQARAADASSQLILDVVVRHTRRETGAYGCTRDTLELFLVPTGYSFS